MSSFQFTLVLAGVSEITPELADKHYEATNGDIEFSMRDGIAVLEFNRAAESLHEAITSAVEAIERGNLGVRVIRVETADANIVAKCNTELLGV